MARIVVKLDREKTADLLHGNCDLRVELLGGGAKCCLRWAASPREVCTGEAIGRQATHVLRGSGEFANRERPLLLLCSSGRLARGRGRAVCVDTAGSGQ